MASKLYVGGLPYSTTGESLREYFARCGTVESATVIIDRFSGQSRGFGFVEMATQAEAQAAIAALDGQTLEGRRIKVSVANAQGPRPVGPSRGSDPRRGVGFGGGRAHAARW
jgi:RNA recognition motif-containing protein